MQESVIDWLLNGEPWVQYRTRLDLLGETKSSPAVLRARRTMREQPLVQGLVENISWPWGPLTNHKNASHPLHKLTFLADLGFNGTDPEIAPTIKQITQRPSGEGPFAIPINIPRAFGGTGENIYAWIICDAPVVLYALVRFGLAEDERVQKAIEYLAGLVRENGFPCRSAADLGKFHGPGRRSDSCPYANLLMVKLLTLLPDWRNSTALKIAAGALLNHWEQDHAPAPFMFRAGTDFRKLKVPFIWYDLLHVLDALSACAWLKDHPSYRAMCAQVVAKATDEGLYTPESVWQAWREWDFGQKKRPSRWLTFCVLRAINGKS